MDAAKKKNLATAVITTHIVSKAVNGVMDTSAIVDRNDADSVRKAITETVLTTLRRRVGE